MIQIVTLNLNRGFSRCGIDRAFDFLSMEAWDVACLQEVSETHLDTLARLFPKAQHFASMAKHLLCGVRTGVGIGIFSRHAPFISTSVHAYAGNVKPVPELEGVEIDSEGNARPKVPEGLALVRATESRLVAFVELNLGINTLKIGTTHGTWTPGGVVDDYQRKSMNRLGTILAEQGRNCALVVAGDFNASRYGEIHQGLLRKSGLLDCTPEHIINTVDWKMRGKEGPDLVVDYLLSRGCEVTEMRTHFSVSDHAAVSATINI